MLLATIGFVVLSVVCLAEEGPRVTVTKGRLLGKFKTTKGGRTFSAFEGIPYAKPPLGQLRFKPPVPVESWNDVKKVTEVHNICPQRDIYRRATLIEGDEDCLYLNVYTPQLKLSTEPLLPVMIFFHGGGWLCGGGNSMWYGPDILLDRDVALVVPNYRLGALGFLTTGDEVAPGNNGMKDQNLALKWVKENIQAFGGDPNLITLFGESAGGVSVQLHMVSPLSRGLFKAGISQSGTAHCPWTTQSKARTLENAYLLGKEFGCSTDNSTELLECLRNVPANDIIAKDIKFMKWDTDPMIPFRPVIEPDLPGAFLTEHPIETMKSDSFFPVPWIVGLNTNDGALRAAGIVSNDNLLEEFDKRFDEIIPVSLIYDEASPEQVKEITKKIRKFYFDGKKIDESAKDDIANLYTDGWFLNGADEAIRYYLKYSNQPVFYYLFGHRGVASFTEIFGDKNRDYGVCHADELQYLFPVGDGLFPDRPPSLNDKKVAKIMTTMWVNFAKTGNPTPHIDDVIATRWFPVKDDTMDYLHITANDVSMQNGLLLERAKFWRSLKEISHVIKDEL